MTKFDLVKLIRRRRGLRVILKAIEESEGSKAEYLKILRRMLRDLKEPARSAESEADLRRLEMISEGLVSTADRMVSQVLRVEAKRHTKAWKASIKRQFGIDLSAVIRDEDLEEHLRLAAGRSAGLIKGLAADAVKRVQNTIYDGIIRGESASTVAQKLTHDFSVSDSRAKLIARDQMAKFNGDLTKLRHQQAGIDRYVWSTSKDERVRPRHRHLDGIEYRYGEKTGAEGGLPPGQPILCRCSARGVVVF